MVNRRQRRAPRHRAARMPVACRSVFSKPHKVEISKVRHRGPARVLMLVASGRGSYLGSTRARREAGRRLRRPEAEVCSPVSDVLLRRAGCWWRHVARGEMGRYERGRHEQADRGRTWPPGACGSALGPGRVLRYDPLRWSDTRRTRLHRHADRRRKDSLPLESPYRGGKDAWMRCAPSHRQGRDEPGGPIVTFSEATGGPGAMPVLHELAR